MARNIKKIAHDLNPLADAITELSILISQILAAIESSVNFDEAKTKKYFEDCSSASQKMALSAKLISKYVQEINREADNEGITKD